MATPELHLRTLFTIDGEGRISGTREPGSSKGPLLALAVTSDRLVWAVRSDLDRHTARELARLAEAEPSHRDPRARPSYAGQYEALVRSTHPGASWSGGPAFYFPDELPDLGDAVSVDDEKALTRHFHGWTPGEIAAGRAPVLAVVEDDDAVSICFCARLSNEAAEAGVETAPGFRGRGFAARATAAWAAAIRASGRVPLYSTTWQNGASLAVARKLGLIAYCAGWSLTE